MPNSGLLIIGAPRSGTTLLASMIGAHPETAITIEDNLDWWCVLTCSGNLARLAAGLNTTFGTGADPSSRRVGFPAAA